MFHSVILVFCCRFSKITISFWNLRNTFDKGIFSLNGVHFPFHRCSNLFLLKKSKAAFMKGNVFILKFEILSQSQDMFSWKGRQSAQLLVLTSGHIKKEVTLWFTQFLEFYFKFSKMTTCFWYLRDSFCWSFLTWN